MVGWGSSKPAQSPLSGGGFQQTGMGEEMVSIILEYESAMWRYFYAMSVQPHYQLINVRDYHAAHSN